MNTATPPAMKPGPTCRNNCRNLWILAVLGIVLAGLVLYFRSGQGGPPNCGSPSAVASLRDIFNASPDAKARSLTLVDVRDHRELTPAEPTPTRICEATVTLNDAETLRLEYRMTPREDGTFLLTFTTKP